MEINRPTHKSASASQLVNSQNLSTYQQRLRRLYRDRLNCHGRYSALKD